MFWSFKGGPWTDCEINPGTTFGGHRMRYPLTTCVASHCSAAGFSIVAWETLQWAGPTWGGALIYAVSLVFVLALMLLKPGQIAEIARTIWAKRWDPWFLATIALYAFGASCYYRGLALVMENPSYYGFIAKTKDLIVLAVAFGLLKERVNAKVLGGIGMALLGVAMIKESGLIPIRSLLWLTGFVGCAAAAHAMAQRCVRDTDEYTMLGVRTLGVWVALMVTALLVEGSDTLTAHYQDADWLVWTTLVAAGFLLALVFLTRFMVLKSERLLVHPAMSPVEAVTAWALVSILYEDPLQVGPIVGFGLIVVGEVVIALKYSRRRQP